MDSSVDEIGGSACGATEDQHSAGKLDARYWEVEVRVCGERILTIGHDHLSGLSDIEQYADVVRTCAEHLASFIGSGEPVPCFACGDTQQERWMGANGEEIGPCSVCSAPEESFANSPSEASAGNAGLDTK